MDHLNDAVIQFDKECKEVLFRVPLSMIIDYRGIRCIVTCDPPLIKDDDAIRLGPNEFEGVYREDPVI